VLRRDDTTGYGVDYNGNDPHGLRTAFEMLKDTVVGGSYSMNYITGGAYLERRSYSVVL